MKNDHYVYVHRKFDTGEIFFVGKGRGLRSSNFSARTDDWIKVAFAHGVTVEHVAINLTKEEAMVEACALTSRLAEAGVPIINRKLVVPRRVIRRAGVSSYSWKNIVVPVMACGTVQDMAWLHGCNPAALDAILDGRQVVTSDGWISNEPLERGNDEH